MWIGTAKHNNAIYREVFPLVPHDDIQLLCELKKGEKHESIVSSTRLAGVRGHLIPFPLDFLSDEELYNSIKPGLQNVDLFFADADIFT